MTRFLLGAISILGIVNFFIFVPVAIALGGDALSGYVSNGHYFLGMHGHYTEVTRSVFNYSKIHAYSVIVSYPVALLVAVKLGWHKRSFFRKAPQNSN
jgi:hypothetical protein